MNMQTSTEGLALIQSFESFRHQSYKDGGGILTIGWGHTGSDVYPGQVITQDQGVVLLRRDLAVAEHCVNIGVRVPLTQNQFDALVSFTYNCGVGNFLKSDLRTVLNAGDYIKAAAHFGNYIHDAHGVVEPGLVRRRATEAELFMKAVTNA